MLPRFLPSLPALALSALVVLTFTAPASLQAQPTVILSQPLGEANFASGSSFYVNAQAFDRLPGTIDVSFTAAGAALPGVRQLGEFYGVEFFPNSGLPFPFDLEVTAQNSLGQSSSFALRMRQWIPANTFPVIQMLPLLPGPQIQAGGIATLRARASTASARTTVDRVEFYVNKVFVGASSTVVPGTVDEYQFPWQTPPTTGNFEVSARVISQNGTGIIVTDPGPPAVTISVPVYASVITRAPVVLNTAPGVLPSVAIIPPVDIIPPADWPQLPLNVPTRISALANVAGGSIQQVQFYVDGRPLGAPDTAAPYVVDFTPTSFGSYELFAIATSSAGLINISPTLRVTVPRGTPPAVSLIRPVSTDQFFPGNPITMQAAAMAYGATITRVEFYVNGFPVATDVTAPFEGSYTPPAGGSYTIFARATDSVGNEKDSSSLTVTVLDIDPNAGPNQARVLEAFQKLLNRAPTPAENQYWVGMLARGTAQSTMVMEIMSSAEYNDFQNKLLGFYYQLKVTPVNSTYIERLSLMKADPSLLPAPASGYPPLGSDGTPAPYRASAGGALAAHRIVSSPEFSAASFGVQNYGNQDFMRWFFLQWPYGTRGNEFALVNTLNAYVFPKGYAVSFINALMYAANDVSSFDSQLKATSFRWLYFGIWDAPTPTRVTNAVELRAFIRSQLGEPPGVPIVGAPPPPPPATAPTLQLAVSDSLTVSSRTRRIVLRGTASDDIAPTAVQFRVKAPGSPDYGAWATVRLPGRAAKSKLWRRTVVLPSSGIWTVDVRALDASGNTSAIRTVTITRP